VKLHSLNVIEKCSRLIPGNRSSAWGNLQIEGQSFRCAAKGGEPGIHDAAPMVMDFQARRFRGAPA
jgi:hypothetical protein